jgi:CHASE2 domain-containing sensor protein
LRYYLEGRFVLVGMVGVETQRSDGDLHPTIGSLQSMAGVEIHASIAGNLLDGSWIHRASPDLSLSIALSVASLSLALGLALPASIGSLCGLLALAIATLASYITVTQYHLFVLGLSVVGGSVLTLMFLQLARLIVARSP